MSISTDIDPKTMTTGDLALEAARTEHLLGPTPISPQQWVDRGDDLSDFPLTSGKPLCEATAEDLKQDLKAMAVRIIHLERLAAVHREMATRRLEGKTT